MIEKQDKFRCLKKALRRNFSAQQFFTNPPDGFFLKYCSHSTEIQWSALQELSEEKEVRNCLKTF